MASGSHKAVYAALIGNALITVLKFAVALVTRSSAMMAEAFHSMADMGNQALLIVGIKRSSRPPDERHPFGYGKEQYFWSFIVAVMLFLMGAVFSIYEGVNKLFHPHEVERIYLIYIILGISLLIEGLSITFALKEFLKQKGDISVWEALEESKDPNLVVVLVEDGAALLGLVIALSGAALVQITGRTVFDAVASIMIGGILALIAFFLANEMRKLLIGESACAANLSLIKDAVCQYPEVVEIGEVLTMHLGPDNILLAMDIDFDDRIPAGELEVVIDGIEQRIRECVPQVKKIFIEANGVKDKLLVRKKETA
ncbi:MAG: cation transporter [Nitrospirae bacterium]|nr:cation transporter [Nitrospirota bacterium]